MPQVIDFIILYCNQSVYLSPVYVLKFQAMHPPYENFLYNH